MQDHCHFSGRPLGLHKTVPVVLKGLSQKIPGIIENICHGYSALLGSKGGNKEPHNTSDKYLREVTPHPPLNRIFDNRAKLAL